MTTGAISDEEILRLAELGTIDYNREEQLLVFSRALLALAAERAAGVAESVSTDTGSETAIVRYIAAEIRRALLGEKG